ncbi:MAG: hypothetical protein E2O73_06245, partial [Deltaproteobacteria bacterium]
MAAKMIIPRLLVALLVAAVALPASAQVFDVVPYQLVGAFGSNNERDTNEGSCDLEFGCISNTGNICADDPNQGCVLATVPAGRCVSGNRPDNLWPSKGGECVGTSGFFERGPAKLGNIQQNSVGGYPCVTDTYAAALAIFAQDPDRDSTEIDALEADNGPSSMCPNNGICAHKRCAVAPAGIGVVACETNADCTATPEDECVQVNDNSANCQGFDPKSSVCFSDNSRKCGIDQDCAKTCSGGVHNGESCETSLLDCKDGVGTNPGDCVPIPGDCILTRCERDPSIGCVNDADCGKICSDGFRDGLECQDSLPDCQLDPNDPGECVVEFPGGCSVPANDFEPGICGGTQARCSDGDPDLAVGGVGLGLCSD